MKCPYCQHEGNHVVETRRVKTENAIRRRRECTSCYKRWTTSEQKWEEPNESSTKKRGRRKKRDHRSTH